MAVGPLETEVERWPSAGRKGVRSLSLSTCASPSSCQPASDKSYTEQAGWKAPPPSCRVNPGFSSAQGCSAVQGLSELRFGRESV